MKKYKFYIPILMLAIFALWLAPLQYRDRQTELVKIFSSTHALDSNGAKGAAMLEDEVRQHLMQNSSSVDNAITYLQISGSKVEIVSDPNAVTKLNEEYAQSKSSWSSMKNSYVVEDYDVFIFATRRPVTLNPLRILFSAYDITLFIKDGSIRWATSSISTKAL